jgi:hypothetical protein
LETDVEVQGKAGFGKVREIKMSDRRANGDRK